MIYKKKKGRQEKKKKFINKVVPTLLAVVCTVSYMALSGAREAKAEKAIRKFDYVLKGGAQEVIQVFQKKDEPGKIRFNIAGQPGVHFKIYYSLTGEENTYSPLPDGHGEINENGIVSHVISTENFPKKDIFLKVFTSNDCDFDKEVRTMAAPLQLIYENKADTVEDKLSETAGWGKILAYGKRLSRRRWNVRTPNVVLGVRGSLPLKLNIEKRDQ